MSLINCLVVGGEKVFFGRKDVRQLLKIIQENEGRY